MYFFDAFTKHRHGKASKLKENSTFVTRKKEPFSLVFAYKSYS